MYANYWLPCKYLSFKEFSFRFHSWHLFSYKCSASACLTRSLVLIISDSTHDINIVISVRLQHVSHEANGSQLCPKSSRHNERYLCTHLQVKSRADIQCMYISQFGTKCVITIKEFWSITRQAFLPTAHTPTDKTNKLHPEDFFNWIKRGLDWPHGSNIKWRLNRGNLPSEPGHTNGPPPSPVQASLPSSPPSKSTGKLVK